MTVTSDDCNRIHDKGEILSQLPEVSLSHLYVSARKLFAIFYHVVVGMHISFDLSTIAMFRVIMGRQVPEVHQVSTDAMELRYSAGIFLSSVFIRTCK